MKKNIISKIGTGHRLVGTTGLHLFLVALVTLVATNSAFAQETPESTLTNGITTIITSGTVVGMAALGIFVAYVTISVVKKFFFAGK